MLTASDTVLGRALSTSALMAGLSPRMNACSWSASDMSVMNCIWRR